MNETTATIDLYIVVDYGVRIPELSWEIQENVKNSVETMTGLDVQKVNIHIEGVSFEKEKEEKIGSRSQRIKKRDERGKRDKRNCGKKEAGKEKTSGSDPQKNTNGIKRRKTSGRQIHIHL